MIVAKYDILTLLKIAIVSLFSKLFISLNIRSAKSYPLFFNRKRIFIGKSLVLGAYTRVEACGDKGKVIFGNNVKINDFVHIGAIDAITIGHNVLIGSRVTIVDQDHGTYSGINQSNPIQAPDNRELSSSPILIGNNCWIGEGVIILKGVILPEGTIVAANSVVTSSPEKAAIIAGIPSRVLKEFDEESCSWIKK